MSTHDPVQDPDRKPAEAPEGADRVRLAAALQRYRALANVVGVLLIVLCLVGLPLNEAHLVDPAWFPLGSDAQQVDVSKN